MADLDAVSARLQELCRRQLPAPLHGLPHAGGSRVMAGAVDHSHGTVAAAGLPAGLHEDDPWLKLPQVPTWLSYMGKSAGQAMADSKAWFRQSNVSAGALSPVRLSPALTAAAHCVQSGQWQDRSFAV